MPTNLSTFLGSTYIGSQGTQGLQGLQGRQGTQGLQGLAGPSNTLSASAVTTNSTFYPVFVAGTGNQTPSIVTDSEFSFAYNPSTKILEVGGKLGVGLDAPEALIQIAGGTSSANTAPLKINSGTNLSAIEANAFEYDGKILYHTDNDTTNGHGRALIPELQTILRTGNVSINDTTSPGTSAFGATTRPTLLAGYTYEVQIMFYVTKVTNNGTVTMQLSTSAGNFTYASMLVTSSTTSQVISGTTSPVTIFTSGNLTAGVSYNILTLGVLRPDSNCKLDILAYSSTASFDVLATSYLRVINIGTANIGNIG